LIFFNLSSLSPSLIFVNVFLSSFRVCFLSLSLSPSYLRAEGTFTYIITIIVVMAHLELAPIIVDKLNKPPFRKRLTLVSFDEFSAEELVRLLNDILAYLDPAHGEVDIVNEPREQRGTRIAQFLHTLKFQYPPHQVAEFKKALCDGARSTVYPVLHYLLSRLPQMKKRAYLAKFLLNVNVPTEFLQDEEVESTYAHYKQLQNDFKAAHKKVDKLRATHMAPKEIRSEIRQLQDERVQLKEKILKMRRKAQKLSGFERLLELTGALRSEQEEETKLNERKQEQSESLQRAKMRVDSAERQLEELETSPTLRMSPDDLLQHLTKKVAEKRAQVKEILPRQLEKLHANYQTLQGIIAEPRSESDVRALQNKHRAMEQRIYDLEIKIKQLQADMKDDRLNVFRQQAALVKKKLSEKQEIVAELEKEAASLQQRIDDKESVLSELNGPLFMKRDEFKQFASKLRVKTAHYKKLKAQLAAICAESVVLSRTEQILKSRDDNLQDLMTKIEEKNGVLGYMDTQRELVKVSQLKATTDKLKGKTLEEISDIVSNINKMLRERESSIKPQVKELRQVRREHSDVKQKYDEKRVKYDNAAAGLESDRLALERDAHHMQEEAIRIESRYHHLNCLASISRSRLYQVEQEKVFLNPKSDERLHRDCKSYSELYANKLSQQMSLTKVLHKRQRELKENAGDFKHQREGFSNLLALLECKLKCVAKRYSDTERQKSTDIAMFEEGSRAGGSAGGANVMKI